MVALNERDIQVPGLFLGALSQLFCPQLFFPNCVVTGSVAVSKGITTVDAIFHLNISLSILGDERYRSLVHIKPEIQVCSHRYGVPSQDEQWNSKLRKNTRVGHWMLG